MTAAQELTKLTEEVTALARLWTCLMDEPPETTQFYHWLLRFGFAGTKDAIERTAHKLKLLRGDMSAEYRRKYCTSVAKNAQAQAEATKRKHSYPYTEQSQ
jgi:hypothetical protein